MKLPILSEIRKKNLSPVYVLAGAEAFPKREIVEAALGLIPEGMRDFNYEVFHGPDIDMADVAAAAQTLPVMSPFRVVLLKHFVPRSAGNMAALIDYAKRPSPTTCLIISSDEEVKLSDWKELEGRATLQTFSRLKPWLVQNEIRDLVRKKGYQITAGACDHLVESVGESLERIANEVEKLILYKGEGKVITEDDVDALSGGGREHTIFNLLDSLSERKAGSALQQLRSLLRGGQLPYVILGMIAGQVRKRYAARLLRQDGWEDEAIACELKIRAYRDRFFGALSRFTESEMRAILKHLHRADVRMKSSTSADLVLENLVCSICSGAQTNPSRRNTKR
jgi:DNA polymerase-3 subunit delta